MTHHCHAVGCSKDVPPKMLFCLPHWRMVPRDWQQIIWREYQPGQERRKDPSPQYLLVQAIVVAIVARREGQFDKAQAEEHIGKVAERVWQHIDRAWVNTLPHAGI